MTLKSRLSKLEQKAPKTGGRWVLNLAGLYNPNLPAKRWISNSEPLLTLNELFKRDREAYRNGH